MTPGVDLDDLHAFFLVVETGSFARAADRLGVAKSIVSRRVAHLEDQLKARLLTRTARGTQTTDVGALYYAKAREAMAQLEAAQEAVNDAMLEVAGPIRLSAPLSFGVSHLAPVLTEFAVRNPRIELDVSFDDRRVDVLGGGFDVVIRIGELTDSTLIARRIGHINGMIVASPDYLSQKGMPQTPDDLGQLDCLLYTNVAPGDVWRFVVNGEERMVRIPVRLRSDNGDMLLSAAVAGLGVARLPAFISSEAIASGQVVPILPEYNTTVPLCAVMPPGRSRTARVRALVDFLALRFANEVL
ncbi:LysR family transcriptional regulator [Asticcacaulis excentricus]|uniref:Transcriptional regulator, LysR family n=1 Tax=Asticcacaulis excentricus (strain ATCC 15261 / DSM 4724 / KCTC 12464 / NCIMB 9791 / VKM B-1370 / CB 48) TaxID=573065 RepID=E8RUX1_ASTEC|nr:LysR family transcriptional regulator [Asticcacaulis excentricus]ADU14171.1 transcriptional regulator, LysR family [Asticcacaulis excentricus CB 48]